MNKRIKFLAVTILLIIIGGYIYFGESPNSTEAKIKNSIEGYYDCFYSAWMNWEPSNCDEYLDLSSIQSYNKTIVLKVIIEQGRYAAEKKYTSQETLDSREIYELIYEYVQVDVDGDHAEVKVDIQQGQVSGRPAYPYFVTFGENIFHLKNISGKWLIQSHDYPYMDKEFIERSRTEKIIFDLRKIHDNVDRDYQ